MSVKSVSNETPYSRAISKAKKIHDERAKAYGDEWVYDAEYAVMELWGKANRARRLLKKPHEYERLEDTLLDAINYGAFALGALEKVKKE